MKKSETLLFCLVTKAIVLRGSCVSCPLTPGERRSAFRRGQWERRIVFRCRRSNGITGDRRKYMKRRKIDIPLCSGVKSHKVKGISELSVEGIVLHQLNKIFGEKL